MERKKDCVAFPMTDLVERSGARLLVDQLLIQGVNHVFCVPGESYLGVLDALVDGGSPGLRSVIINYLGIAPSNGTVQGAIWLILNSPEYAVN